MTVFRSKPFRDLRTRIEGRFSEFDVALSHVQQLDAKVRRGTSTQEEENLLKILKGYLIVNLYAIIEFCYNEILKTGYLYIEERGVGINRLTSQLLAFAIENKWKSLIDTIDSKKYEVSYKSKIDLVEGVRSSAALSFNNSEKPRINGNFNKGHLDVACMLLDTPVTHLLQNPHTDIPTVFTTITLDRHNVSHGSKSVEDVGKKYSYNEIKNNRDKIESFMLHFIRIMNDYCVQGRYKK